MTTYEGCVLEGSGGGGWERVLLRTQLRFVIILFPFTLFVLHRLSHTHTSLSLSLSLTLSLSLCLPLTRHYRHYI